MTHVTRHGHHHRSSSDVQKDAPWLWWAENEERSWHIGTCRAKGRRESFSPKRTAWCCAVNGPSRPAHPPARPTCQNSPPQSDDARAEGVAKGLDWEDAGEECDGVTGRSTRASAAK